MVGICFAWNPFDAFLNPPAPEEGGSNPTEISTNTTMPFLQAFMLVYQGDWIYISGQDFASVDIMVEPCVCNQDETECCGRWELRSLDNPEDNTTLEGLFCLQSTYDIRLRDLERKTEFRGVGVRGARMENPLHECLEGYSLDDPKIIDCGIFRLVRPE